MRLLAALVLSFLCVACVQPARADRFGDIDFHVPAGWQKLEKGGFTVLAGPLDAHHRPRAAIFVTPGTAYSGDFSSWFRSAVIQGESNETSIRRGGVQRIQARGNYDALTIDSVAADRQGFVTHRKYIGANPGGRAEMFVYIAYDAPTAQRYLPGLREFLDSVRYVQLVGERSNTTPAPAQARPSQGTHCHIVTRQQCTSGMSGGFGGTMTPTYSCLPVSKTVCD
jgi:hypothetical protein